MPIRMKKSAMKYKDNNGNMQDSGVLFGTHETDLTLTKAGVPADAKKTGEKLDTISSDITILRGDIPSYWQSHLDSKIASIKELQDEAGKDGFSFIVIADPHYPQNLGKKSPLLAKYVMDSCNIRYVLVLGDMQNRGQWRTKEQAESDWIGIKAMFKIIEDSVLFQKGNHDGSWGYALNGVTYPYNFTEEEMYNRVYAPTYRYHNAVTDESGTGYYVDDTAKKVRYIMLNTHCNPYEENEDGSAKYNNMSHARYTQSQYDFLINEALKVPVGYKVIVGSHIAPNNGYSSAFGGDSTVGDHIIMRNLLRAYKVKTIYSTSWSGVYGYDSININADFSSYNGEFVAYVAGHAHNDYIYYAKDGWGVDMITSRCDSANENTSALLEERVAGTITEQSFDVYTVNSKTGVINITKVGAGSDRALSYKESEAEPVYYQITNSLTRVTSSNAVTTVKRGLTYTATLTANSGYVLTSVKVMMGGTDITSTAYSNGKVSISRVTGDIVITASATVIEDVPTTGNLYDTSANGYEVVEGASYNELYTNWIPYNQSDNNGKGTIYHLKGATPYKMQWGNESLSSTTQLMYVTNANVQAGVTADYDSDVILIQHTAGADYKWLRFYFRSNSSYPDDSFIITANENIVEETTGGNEGTGGNVIPTSTVTATSSEIFNGVGYQNNAYCPSSDGTTDVSTTTANEVVSGFFPIDISSTSNPVIYMKGVTWDSAQSHCRMTVYNSQGNYKYSAPASWGKYCTVEELDTQYYRITFDGTAFSGQFGKVTHIRMSAIGSGENWIIQVNNPID